jgi:hypothetical protein
MDSKLTTKTKTKTKTRTKTEIIYEQTLSQQTKSDIAVVSLSRISLVKIKQKGYRERENSSDAALKSGEQ